jgi:hypothetical protein
LIRKKARKVHNLSQYCICCSKDIPWWDMMQWSLIWIPNNRKT